MSSVCQLHHQMKPRPHSPFETSDNRGGSNTNANGGWSSLYSLCAPSSSLSSSSSSSQSHHKLSRAHTPSTVGKKNWELCTETLGCENGAAYYVADFNAVVTPTTPHRRQTAEPEGKQSKKTAFPPPLTTLSGQERLQMVSSREDGRLLLIPAKSRPPLLEAQRTEGRLCLRLLSGAKHSEKQEANAKDAPEDEEEEEEEEDGYLGIVGKEMNGLNHNSDSGVAEEMGMGRFARASGCKEEEGGGRSKAMVNWDWDAIWVATS